jgi:hypothetical protein
MTQNKPNFHVLPKLSTRSLSAIGVFAALQAVVSVIPFSIAIGVSGSITLGVVTAPLFGLLLGFGAGTIAVLVGSIVGLFINPSGAIFGFLTAIPPALAAFGTGSVREGRGYLPAIIILLSVIAFYAHPFGRESLFYPWLHIIALILALSPASKLASTYVNSTMLRKTALGVAFAASVGTLTDQAFGSALGIWYFSLPASVWNIIMYIYPIERTVTVAIVTVIGVPVYRRLKMSGIRISLDQ